MKIKFLNMQLGIFKCFCKLIQGFLYFTLSFPFAAYLCALPSLLFQVSAYGFWMPCKV